MQLLTRFIKLQDHDDIVISVFLDLNKAFDMVDHMILLNKLYGYGIRGNIHDWFRTVIPSVGHTTHYGQFNNNKGQYYKI